MKNENTKQSSKQNHIATFMLSFVFVAVFAVFFMSAKKAFASEGEAMCKIKAKETAAEVYRNCVTENKTARADELKKDYQDRIKALKEEYDQEMAQISGKKKQIAKKMKAKRIPVTVDENGESDLPDPVPVEM